MKKNAFFLLILLPIKLFCQDSLLWKPLQILHLAQTYQQIEADPEGNLYVIDTKRNKITKLFVETNYDSSYTIGGMSGREEGFLHIAQVCSKNRQSIYVLDDAARRITLLNTNLKVTGGISFLTAEGEETDILPISFEVSGAGEIFILNNLDNKIYKFDNKGKEIISFGGQDYGDGNLKNPVKIAVSDENQVYVLDTLLQEIVIFDMYGTYLEKINLKKIVNNPKNISLFAKDLIIQNNTEIIVLHIPTNKSFILSIPFFLENFTDIAISKTGIFLLLANTIYNYKISW